MRRRHHMPFGAECLDDARTRFRLWAPSARDVAIVLTEPAGARALSMTAAGEGWWERIEAAPAGTRYRFRIDGGQEVPDPASRCNPDDVHGPSQVVDPRAFAWSDSDWRGRPWEEAVLYELHVGTFSPAGTFAGAEARLDYLAELGVTALELMPVADFPGNRNWGYDGVLPRTSSASWRRLTRAELWSFLMWSTTTSGRRATTCTPTRSNFLPRAIIRPGVTPLISTVPAAAPCANSSSTTRSTGSRNSMWTA
jgi:maltooligosyltrehalose trehalohydrolase